MWGYDPNVPRLSLLLVLIAFSGSHARTPVNVPLYQRALSDDAMYEMHCRGMPIEDAQQRFDRKYKDRQDRLRASLASQHLLDAVEPDKEVIPIGFKCPHFIGAEARLRSALRQAERRSSVKQ